MRPVPSTANLSDRAAEAMVRDSRYREAGVSEQCPLLLTRDLYSASSAGLAKTLTVARQVPRAARWVF